ncbi:MAG: 50S ribosomal protein L10 [Clostridia bacterium]|nr:50S ribosomal protein L10 [Clostridia bacterium]
MSKNLEIKKQVVADIAEKLENCKSMVIVKYSGLTVEQVTKLRAQCRAAKVEYCVLKNTLVRRALAEKNIEGLDDVLEGPNAFVFGMEDAVSPAKILSDFIEKEKLKSLELRAGLLDGKAIDLKTIESLAKLPSREVLLAKVLGSMTAAIGNFVRVIEAFRKKQAGEE